MNRVPRVKRVPTATWILPAGNVSSAASTHIQTPSRSRTNFLVKACTTYPAAADRAAARGFKPS